MFVVVQLTVWGPIGPIASSVYSRLSEEFRASGDKFPCTKWTDVEVLMQGKLTKLQNLKETTVTMLDARPLSIRPRASSIVQNFIDLVGCKVVQGLSKRDNHNRSCFMKKCPQGWSSHSIPIIQQVSKFWWSKPNFPSHPHCIPIVPPFLMVKPAFFVAAPAPGLWVNKKRTASASPGGWFDRALADTGVRIFPWGSKHSIG